MQKNRERAQLGEGKANIILFQCSLLSVEPHSEPGDGDSKIKQRFLHGSVSLSLFYMSKGLTTPSSRAQFRREGEA